MHIDYTVQIWKEDSHFIAHAMPLDVMSSGPTPEAARIALDEILQETGYKFQDGKWVSPEWVAIEKHSVTNKLGE